MDWLECKLNKEDIRYNAETVLAGGAGLCFVALFIVLVVFASRYAYCMRTGECTKSDTSVSSTAGYCGNKNFPSILEELESNENHPLLIDLGLRLQEQFESAPEFRDIFVFKGCVFLGFFYKPENNYYLASYQWNGREWEFIALECEMCQ